MGTTNRRRPQFYTEAMANAVIGGNMLQTTQGGANPTWNQPLSSDNVQLNGAHYLQSFAFMNGNAASTIVFNLSLTNSLPVTFSGANAPTGTVQMTQLTSANMTDNNETAAVVEPTTQTLNGFNPAAGLSLPPFSMTVLSWTSTVAQVPQFSVAAGTYSTGQTVSLINTSAGCNHVLHNGWYLPQCQFEQIQQSDRRHFDDGHRSDCGSAWILQQPGRDREIYDPAFRRIAHHHDSRWNLFDHPIGRHHG